MAIFCGLPTSWDPLRFRKCAHDGSRTRDPASTIDNPFPSARVSPKAIRCLFDGGSSVAIRAAPEGGVRKRLALPAFLRGGPRPLLEAQ